MATWLLEVRELGVEHVQESRTEACHELLTDFLIRILQFRFDLRRQCLTINRVYRLRRLRGGIDGLRDGLTEARQVFQPDEKSGRVVNEFFRTEL